MSKKMQIVKIQMPTELGGGHTTLNCSVADSLDTVKTKCLQAKKRMTGGLDAKDYLLLQNGIKLDGSKTLESLALSNGATFNLVRTLSGSPSPSIPIPSNSRSSSPPSSVPSSPSSPSALSSSGSFRDIPPSSPKRSVHKLPSSGSMNLEESDLPPPPEDDDDLIILDEKLSPTNVSPLVSSSPFKTSAPSSLNSSPASNRSSLSTITTPKTKTVALPVPSTIDELPPPPEEEEDDNPLPPPSASVPSNPPVPSSPSGSKNHVTSSAQTKSPISKVRDIESKHPIGSKSPPKTLERMGSSNHVKNLSGDSLSSSLNGKNHGLGIHSKQLSQESVIVPSSPPQTTNSLVNSTSSPSLQASNPTPNPAQSAAKYPPCKPGVWFDSLCPGCGKGFDVGSSLSASNRKFHPEHFACFHCGVNLCHQKFRTHEARPYCPTHYTELFSSKCLNCKKPITNHYVTVTGGEVHPECLSCTTCGELLGSKYKLKGTTPYCELHFHTLYGTICVGCGKPILDRILRALGDAPWHTSCFMCSHCLKPLDGTKFFLKNDNVYCPKDYDALFALRCKGCGQSITGKYVKVDQINQCFHPQCLACAVCKQSLGGKAVFCDDNSDDIFCQQHYDASFATRCGVCHDYIKKEVLHAFDKSYHQLCFICKECKRPATHLEKDALFCDYHGPNAKLAGTSAPLVPFAAAEAKVVDSDDEGDDDDESKEPLSPEIKGVTDELEDMRSVTEDETPDPSDVPEPPEDEDDEEAKREGQRLLEEAELERKRAAEREKEEEEKKKRDEEAQKMMEEREKIKKEKELAAKQAEKLAKEKEDKRRETQLKTETKEKERKALDEERRKLEQKEKAIEKALEELKVKEKEAEQRALERKVEESKEDSERAKLEEEERQKTVKKLAKKEHKKAMKKAKKAKKGGDTHAKSETTKKVKGGIQGHMGHMSAFISYGILKCCPLQEEKIRGDYRKKDIYKPQLHGIIYDFMDYAPRIFMNLRKQYGITQEAFVESVCKKGISGGDTGAGKSGMLFFFSQDRRYIVKTITKGELKFMRKILKAYHKHFQKYPHSMISRFYGLYKITMPNAKPLRLIVMNNLFDTQLKIPQKFDLKGSIRNRYVPDSESPDEHKGVLKDLNYTQQNQKMYVGWTQKQALQKQIKNDCELLTELNIMDQSLLLGVHTGAEDTDPSKKVGLTMIDVNGLKSPLSVDPSKPGEGDLISIFQTNFNGIRGFTEPKKGSTPVPRPEIYYMGIIDILQEFNLKKQLESTYKGIKYNKDAISAISSKRYAQRFMEYLDKHME